jgi:hypothetical protein
VAEKMAALMTEEYLSQPADLLELVFRLFG